MSRINDGRAIASFMVLCDENGNPPTFRPDPGEGFFYFEEYLGDHSEMWVVRRRIATGIEVDRWNAKNVAHIVWADDVPAQGHSIPTKETP